MGRAQKSVTTVGPDEFYNEVIQYYGNVKSGKETFWEWDGFRKQMTIDLGTNYWEYFYYIQDQDNFTYQLKSVFQISTAVFVSLKIFNSPFPS